MALFSNAVRNAGCSAKTALANGGSVEIGTSGMSTVLVTFTLANPAYGSPANGTANGAGLPIASTGAAAGTAASYRVKASDGTLLWSGNSVSLTAGTGEVKLSNLSIAVDQPVSLTSIFFTEPAGSA